MDMSSSDLLSELEMEDIQGLMNEYQMSKLEDHSVNNFCFDSLKNQSFQTKATIEEHEEQPDVKLPSYNKKAGEISKKSLSSNFTISFGDLEPKNDIIPCRDSLDFATTCTKKGLFVVRSPIQAQDHVLAERKRRQKLTHRFILLSALLPNLKKMDKASVLEDATNYIKELQVRVKELEGLLGTKQNDVQESLVYVKRSKLSVSDYHDHGASSSDETNSGEIISSPSCKSSDPEIEVRISGSSVLVRIQCQKKSSSLVKALNEMEKIGLLIISSSAMPFANTTLLITIVAQMGNDFFMTEMDLVKNLQLAF